MELLHWELSVLSRAVSYRNLSGAADNIGISQPQLSRIIGKLEGELEVVLLDRSSRRKSGWAPAAFQLAEVYSNSSNALKKEIFKLTGNAQVSHLRVGTLEGLVPLASAFCHQIFDKAAVHTIELDVHDTQRLEEIYAKSGFDLIFVSREPGRKKPRFSRILGHQTFKKIETGIDTAVVSSFEYQTRADASGRKINAERAQKTLVSNSLAVRRGWLETHGGLGFLPSSVGPRATDVRGSAVHLIASDMISPEFWRKISAIQVLA